jgi:hypothetical protein
MATAAALSAVPLDLARALDLDSNADLITDTIASQEMRSEWSLARKFGAATVDEADRGFAAPDGVRVGNFFIYPSITQSIAYDSNIFGMPDDAIADWRFITSPTLTIQSQLPRHAFEMTVFSRFMNFAENTDQDYVNFGGIARGALHIDHAHTLSATVLATRENEERSAETASRSAAEPVPIDRYRASVGITRDAGRLYGTLAATAETLEYGSVRATDGSLLDQSYRDQEIYSAQLRTGYRISPGFDFVTKLRAIRQLSDGETPGSADRNSTGYEATAGLAFETDPLVRWRIMAGYGVRNYDNAEYADVSSSLMEAQVQWLATDRLTLFANARRSLDDELGANDNGRVQTTASARAEYEIRHDLVGSVNLAISDVDFLGSDRNDRLIESGVGLEYHYTKNWFFSLNYAFESRDSNEAEFDLDRSVVRIGGTLRF